MKQIKKKKKLQLLHNTKKCVNLSREKPMFGVRIYCVSLVNTVYSVRQNLEVTDLIGSTGFNATCTSKIERTVLGKHPRRNAFHLGYTARRSVNTQSATFRLI